MVHEEYITALVTPTATNPYLPAIGRVLEVLRARWQGTPIQISLRDLASEARCAQGAIPPIIKRLEADGHITRLPGFGYLIVVQADQDHDRQNTASGFDHGHDRIEERAESPNGTPDPTLADLDHESDRSGAAWNQHDSCQQQPQHGAVSLSHQSHPVYPALRASGAEESVAEAIIAKHPRLTIAEFDAMRRAAKRRGGQRTPDNIGLVFWCLLNGEPLHAPKEPNNERPAPTPHAERRHDAPDRTRRPRTSAPPERPGLSREYLQSRPRRGDRLRDVSGGGSAAGG